MNYERKYSMSDGIFLSEKNSTSCRWAIFEDDKVSGWLYLTSANEKKPVGDCWIYNRIKAPSPSEIKNYRNGPPPASSDFCDSNIFVLPTDNISIIFRWSNDGNAVALIVDNISLGYIIAGNRGGYSRNLIRNGPWGNVFDEDRYREVFGVD